jgi:hypothetical protein
MRPVRMLVPISNVVNMCLRMLQHATKHYVSILLVAEHIPQVQGALVPAIKRSEPHDLIKV